MQGRRRGDSGDNRPELSTGWIESIKSGGVKRRFLVAVAVVAVSPLLSLWLYALTLRIEGWVRRRFS